MSTRCGRSTRVGVRIHRVSATVPARLHVEPLESRQHFSAAAQPVVALAPPATAASVAGCTPSQIRHAYGFDQVNFGSVAGDGSGQTIAIVDAYGDPNIAADLATFDAQFGVAAPPGFKVMNQNGGSTLPATDAAWALETSLDVEWAHATAPGANIVLVQAESSTLDDLLSAVNCARGLPDVSVVSMSWGGTEFPEQVIADGLFTTPANHSGITFVAAAGDGSQSPGPDWPATSPNVLGVGGTSPDPGAEPSSADQMQWNGSGGGHSQFEPAPPYQSGISPDDARMSPDVAFNADPHSAYAVYDSVTLDGRSGWVTAGGTSAAAPQWAGLIAIVNQGRAIQAMGSLDGATQTIPTLYAMSSQLTDPANAAFSSAGAGYDAGVGLGSPRAPVIVASFTTATTDIAVMAIPTRTLYARKAHPGIIIAGSAPPGTFNPEVVPAPVPSPGGPSLTPLAQTPPRGKTDASKSQTPARQAISLTAVAPPPDAQSAHFAPAAREPAPFNAFGTIAAINPVALASVEIPLGVAVARNVVSVGDHLAVSASEFSSSNTVYNFVTFNPAALLNDTIAAISNELSTLPATESPLAEASARRAWTVTAAVIGFDIVFLGYWRQKVRRERADRRHRAEEWARILNPTSAKAV